MSHPLHGILKGSRMSLSSRVSLRMTAALVAGIALAGGSYAHVAGRETSAGSFTPAQISERAVHRRAVEAVIWGMPVVNYALMYREMVNKTHGSFNQVLYWSRLLDWRNQTLTPNPDVIYLMPFFNTKDVGPVVLEIPPADDGLFNGSVMDRWQAAIEDVGPGGVDKGKGGKYLILPPGYSEEKVPAGYIAMPSDTYEGYALLRSVPHSGSEADIGKAIAYSKRVKVYPLSKASNPPPTKFVDASEVVFDSTIQYDPRFFETLSEMVQAEPWLERDKVMIDPLKTIGIERGKPFHPDAETQRTLNDAILEAKAFLEAEYVGLTPYYEGGHWFFPVTEEMRQNVVSSWRMPDSYPVDIRGLAYSIAFFSAKHLGESQYYLMSISDKGGQTLDGRNSYRLKVPANVPITQYWSTTVYNRATHTFILNAKRVGRSSQTPGLKKNADGSVDIFFAPAPPGGQESNWIPTDPNGRFEVLARFYGPKKSLFDKTWRLSDIEKVNP